MEWLEQFIEHKNSFARLNWSAVSEHVQLNLSTEDQDVLWNNIALAWVDKLKSNMAEHHRMHESDNFILLSSESDHYVSVLLGFLERSRKKILYALRGIAADPGPGKYVVLVFDDLDSYYLYISCLYPEEGVFGLSSGIYINDSYGHFAFPHQEINYAESIAAHELTHALLNHLSLPTWLDEGMAVGMESLITGFASGVMDREMHSRHRAFWNESRVQEFWSGDSFFRADSGQELSYHLAQFLVNSLSQDYDAFVELVNLADRADAGESAVEEIYDGSLNSLISPLLGEGPWIPDPSIWKNYLAK